MINDNFFKKNNKYSLKKKESLRFVNAYLKEEMKLARQKRISLITKPLFSISVGVILIISAFDKTPVVSCLLISLLAINIFSSIHNFKYELRNTNQYIKALKQYRLELINYLMEAENKEEYKKRKDKIKFDYLR